MGLWDRYATFVTARRSPLLLLALLAAAAALIAGIGSNDSATSAPRSLPDHAESARVEQLLRQFPDGANSSALAVITRADGAPLDERDRAAATSAIGRAVVAATGETGSGPLIPAPDGTAVIGPIPVPADLSGLELSDRVDAVREAARTDLPDTLRLEVTGGPAFAADIADSFSGANTTLLAVTALVAAVLLMITYRSPVLWLVPLLVIGLADRVATSLGTALGRFTDLSFDGSTAGITSVLVFGAGTNYALLLVSRYRDELWREPNHRVALRHAVRRAGPAILASNLTVVMALLILLAASVPSTRSLGAPAAIGLVLALVFVLFGLPPALVLCRRQIFWPFVPRPDGRDNAERGMWHAVATRVVARPALVAITATGLLGVCALGVLAVDIGLSRTEQFRVRAESVDGFDTLATHFPGGSVDPTVVVAKAAAAPEVDRALAGVPGVLDVKRTGDTQTGLARWSVVLDATPTSDRSASILEDMRSALSDIPQADALVGGNDAQALDGRDAAARDRVLIVPLILAAVSLVLLVLLRAPPAALLLVAVTVLSALAALGLGGWVGTVFFGFPAWDTNVPLLAFLFLVALGVDYTIFLVTRAREETPEHGTRGGIVRAVSATGAVITSAGAVLAAVFCVLGVLPLITMAQLGLVVGLGVVLDTLVVRTVIVPAWFAVLGPWVWWPGRVDRETASQARRQPVTTERTG
ncbi:MMPL family transporter [Nocardia sp. NPDC050406]|uniref:MMPL family transporter n=1 Tax=Nocardia sp. NPDC050406 TaxID=3364318 RepID=UPI0037A1E094